MIKEKSPKWMFVVLWLAGIYNIVWGIIVFIFPNFIFDFAEMQRPNYPELWQCIGMIVGVYGIGYIIAAYNPYRHWPIVLVGLLGKIFGPIGYILTLNKGTYTLKAGLTNITNDLIWLVPFTIILVKAYKANKESTA